MSYWCHINQQALREQVGVRGGHSCGGFDHHSTVHFWGEKGRGRRERGGLHNATLVSGEQKLPSFVGEKVPSYPFWAPRDDRSFSETE